MNRKAFWAETVSHNDLKIVFQVWTSEWKKPIHSYISLVLQIPFDPVRKYLLETDIAPENGWLEVGRLISFWEGFLERAMLLVSGSVFRHTKNPLQNHLQKGLKHKRVYNDTWPKNYGEIHPYFFDRFDRCQVKVIVFRWWNDSTTLNDSYPVHAKKHPT